MLQFLKSLFRSSPSSGLWIEVTAEDIRSGQPCNPYYCPVSLAMKRSLGGKWTVGLDCAHKRYGEIGFIYHLPKTATNFISAYDRGEDVQPIIFMIGE